MATSTTLSMERYLAMRKSGLKIWKTKVRNCRVGMRAERIVYRAERLRSGFYRASTETFDVFTRTSDFWHSAQL